MTAFLLALVPSAGVLFLFSLAIRALLEADRRERIAEARLDHHDRADRSAAVPSDDPAPGEG